MKRIAIAAVAAVLAVPAFSVAQDTWEGQVRRQLREIGGRLFLERGYSMTHRVYTGSLRHGDYETLTLNLDRGEHQIIGVCDNDCEDVDLILYDANGNQVDSDTQMDDYPVVATSRGGDYTLRVNMADCDREPCRYGIGVWGR